VSKCPPVASLLHVTAGIAGARPLEASRRFSWRAALALTALSLVADVDVLAFRFGIPYSDPFGHRGATHSLVFAVLAGTVTALVLSHGGGGIVTNGHIGFCTRGDRLEFDRRLADIGTQARLVRDREYRDFILMLATENLLKEIDARLKREDLAPGARRRLQYLRDEAPRSIAFRRTGNWPPRSAR